MSSIETQVEQAAVIQERAALAPPEVEAPRGMGWLRDLPDIRDYTIEHENVEPLLAKTSFTADVDTDALPPNADLRQWFSPVEDQGRLGSCTANAVCGLVEYFERRAFGRHLDASRLFLYKATRDLARIKGDSGAYLRNAMGALVLFGVPPEKYWPYNVSRFDAEPTAFCYAFASNYQATQYFRLDPPGTTPEQLLDRIKAKVASKIPLCFGFTVYSSIDQADATGKIPFPTKKEQSDGGHAVVVAGYDDSMEITNSAPGSKPTVGALLIRNSWSKTWGDGGYGWLPYEYVLKRLAVDFWALLKLDWVETGQFS